MRTRKKNVGLILLMATLSVAAVIAGLSKADQDTSASAKQDQATVIQEGIMTEKQKEHSKLYKGFGTGKKLRDLAAGMPGGIKVRRNTPLQVGEPGSSPITLPAFLNGMACTADAVIIGVARSKSSQLTEAGDFIFTDYELNIEEVLKDNVQAHLSADTNITVTRAGGRVQLNGQILEAEDASFKPLKTGGRYILFLKFISDTRAYTSVSSASTFELRDSKANVQTEALVGSQLDGQEAVRFLENVHVATSKACGKSAKGEL